MPGRTRKRSSTPPPPPPSTAPVTGQRVKRRTPLKPTNESKRPTGAKPKKPVKPGASAKPKKASKPGTTAEAKKATKLSASVKPKKAVKPGASTKRRTIPPTTRATHRPAASTAKKSVTFALVAPAGWDVALAGTFNNWQSEAMAKGSDGLWRISLPLPPGTYQYRFLIDTQWREDPNNPRKAPNELGGFNSICEVL